MKHLAHRFVHLAIPSLQPDEFSHSAFPNYGHNCTPAPNLPFLIVAGYYEKVRVMEGWSGETRAFSQPSSAELAQTAVKLKLCWN